LTRYELTMCAPDEAGDSPDASLSHVFKSSTKSAGVPILGVTQQTHREWTLQVAFLAFPVPTLWILPILLLAKSWKSKFPMSIRAAWAGAAATAAKGGSMPAASSSAAAAGSTTPGSCASGAACSAAASSAAAAASSAGSPATASSAAKSCQQAGGPRLFTQRRKPCTDSKTQFRPSFSTTTDNENDSDKAPG